MFGEVNKSYIRYKSCRLCAALVACQHLHEEQQTSER